MSKFFGKEELESLPSKRYYKILESVGYYCLHNDIDSLEEQLNKNFHSNDISRMLVKALCETSFKAKDSDECKERCQYLYVWIANTLYHNLKNRSDFSKVTNILSDILRASTTSGNCYCDIRGISEENSNKIKAAYDYYKDYESIYKTLNFHSYPCKPEYKQYLDNTFSMYEEVYTDCKSKVQNYCTNFIKFIPNFLNTHLPSITCKTIEGDSQSQYIGALESSTVHDSVFLEETPTSTAISTSNIITSIFLPIGMLLIFSLLYNFSPFGSWIRKHMGMKKTIKHYLNDITGEELVEHDYKEDEINGKRTRFKVAYHSK
ncbi:PIR Superfamily Protein [Plasmodium ovale curtisi]|uniref:PIR Superfamily Protein n=1 Tax=Plasmodium ovale curtisi TaxID=864141 RepID=A0A1A8X6L6_PLAOA|nr:PIR Superfamily Protein [Plasmodium ovale curtisi]SBT00253.1 PIR Superfamily Protein [Plasmodium ovale curtisi]